MKISELIAKLEEMKAKYGDLPCVTHDGLNPSDPSVVCDVEIERDEYAWLTDGPPYAFIRS